MRKPLAAPRFRFRPLAFAVTVLLVILGVMLGNRQTHRAQEKIATQDRLAAAASQPALALDAAAIGAAAPASLEFRHVRLQGRFIDWPARTRPCWWRGAGCRETWPIP